MTSDGLITRRMVELKVCIASVEAPIRVARQAGLGLNELKIVIGQLRSPTVAMLSDAQAELMIEELGL
jgi:hypothetical protein